MIWDEFLRHFRFCDEEDSGLSDEEQERKRPKNRPKHTRKRIHQAKKNFLEKFKTASLVYMNSAISQCRGGVRPPVCVHVDVFGQATPAPTS
ncbi:hypothetical protein QVO10_14770 [Bacteroides gallinaceum]|uniref:Uncharacterized protein n=2 Tax=Bacteroides TaxID=816 RepID=A0ABT7X962_9BACE|nr:hypothetical protein [Bacteroides gallinaceum]MDN0050622.1 hypothetical protein [Bacteroides gallinaceum]